MSKEVAHEGHIVEIDDQGLLVPNCMRRFKALCRYYSPARQKCFPKTALQLKRLFESARAIQIPRS
ncbi:hypothetical protein GL4_0716 [Methyloceanibacter caenitepidi]|uniref:Uncharacterized protein n=1 Tax=Methyloceanibacter caenitepidi TaxID=1384459 RepID=A0A0A8K2F6_9HYPH|nr:hypothetical protein GL4_0716 [Methyloceanibacter caenitepidi]